MLTRIYRWVGREHIYQNIIYKSIYTFLRPICAVVCNLILLAVRLRYCLVLKRLRKVVRLRRLRVAFVIGDPAKWKCQSVYDDMLSSDMFEPYVAPSVMDLKMFSAKEQVERVRLCREYFKKVGVRVIDVVAEGTATTMPFSRFGIDIVIYQQPWDLSDNQHPISVSKYALTFYVPYYTPTTLSLLEMYTSEFHRSVWTIYFEHSCWINAIRASLPRFYIGARLSCVRFPLLVEMFKVQRTISPADVVIYAPHWSVRPDFSPIEFTSTFLETGRWILEYAQKHPEIKWAFRPHPLLRHYLSTRGVWSDAEIDEYFGAWEKIGMSSYGGSYLSLFAKSRALITDCVTFVSEYLAFDRPLIRLERNDEVPCIEMPGLRKLDGMYRVRTLDELSGVFNDVLENRCDRLKDERAAVIAEFGYRPNIPSLSVCDDIKRVVEFDCSYDD